jgi:hypothetical protein
MRVAAYAQSPIILNWIPIAGPRVGGIWDLCLFVIGLKEMHQTTYGRVIASILIPGVLCLALILVPILGLTLLRSGR